MSQTISATEFKAKCLDILDRVSRGEIEQLTITKRGQSVAVLVPPPLGAGTIDAVYGRMRGSVIALEDVDLAAPISDEPLDAEQGILHR